MSAYSGQLETEDTVEPQVLSSMEHMLNNKSVASLKASFNGKFGNKTMR